MILSATCTLNMLLLFVVCVFLSRGEGEQTENKEEHILGSSVLLKCPSNVDKPVRTTVWDFNGKHIVTDNNKYTVTKGRLTIKRLDLRDKGLYKCTQRFFNSSLTNRQNTHLDVLYPPVILKKPSSSPVMEGHNLTLTCMADGNPAIKYEWLKEKMITDLIRAKVKLSEGKKNLTIVGIKKADEGRYFCKVSNSLGIKESFVDVKILIPPSVKLSSLRMVQVEGSSLKLICEASGIPMPKLAWALESKETMSSSEHSIRLQPGMAIITIGKLKRGHAGSITCEASNSAGFDSSSALLAVQFHPEVVTDTNEVRAWPGLDLILACNVTSEPLAHVTWLKNKQVISSDANTSISSLKVSEQLVTSTLMATVGSDLANESSYTCEARNVVATNKSVIRVIKEALPDQPEIEFIDEGHESVRIIMKKHDDDDDEDFVVDDDDEYDDYYNGEDSDNDGSKYKDGEDDRERADDYNGEVKTKYVKANKINRKNNLNQGKFQKDILNKGNSKKDIIKDGKPREEGSTLPLLYWKVTIEKEGDSTHRSTIIPYANEILLDNLYPSVMYNLTIVVSNYVGYSPPLYTQVFTSDMPIHALEKNMTSQGALVKKTSKKLPLPPSDSDSEVASGFIMVVGVGSVVVVVVIFVLIGLVLCWQKRSLEKAKLLGKCPQHNVVTTLTRHDLEAQRSEVETLRGDRVAELSRQATATAHLSPIGYYKGDTVDDVIDHLNASYCNT